MCLFPALDDDAPDDNQQNYSPFYSKRVVGFLSIFLSSITWLSLGCYDFLKQFPIFCSKASNLLNNLHCIVGKST